VKPTTLLSFRGRLPRSSFAAWLCLTAVILALLSSALATLLPGRGLLVVYLPFYWAFLALAVKRLHDRGKSGKWLLLALVPLLGAVWLAIELFFLPGTPGENRYGADPLASNADYLAVG
jgi:uncharacterized membrane protein YhaH (DUF805 family)